MPLAGKLVGTYVRSTLTPAPDAHAGPSPAAAAPVSTDAASLTPSFQTARRAAAYRRDLDGLRGVAIALVAVFHVWFGRVSGGVDVFLALSGFFFGSSLLRSALGGVIAVAVVTCQAAGLAPSARPDSGAFRRCGTYRPGSAPNPVGCVRRPDAGQSRLLPELGTGGDRVELPARRRGSFCNTSGQCRSRASST